MVISYVFSYLMQRAASNDNLLSLFFRSGLSPDPRSARTRDRTASKKRERLFQVAANQPHNPLACHVAENSRFASASENRQAVLLQYMQTCDLPA